MLNITVFFTYLFETCKKIKVNHCAAYLFTRTKHKVDKYPNVNPVVVKLNGNMDMGNQYFEQLKNAWNKS